LKYTISRIRTAPTIPISKSIGARLGSGVGKGSGKAVCKGKHLAGKVSPRRKAYRLSDFVKEIDKEQIGGI
jgi:hypothetical protein